MREEYRKKAERVDRMFGEEEGRGRMRRRLDQFGPLIGLISGLFNEASSDTHSYGRDGHRQDGEGGQGLRPKQLRAGGGEGEGSG